MIPKAIITDAFFAAEKKAIADAEIIVSDLENTFNEFVEEQSDADGVLFEYLNDKDAVDNDKVTAKVKVLKKKKPLTEDNLSVACF